MVKLSNEKSDQSDLPISVCACGKWICYSHICTEGYRDIETREEDEEEDEESPEDDPDVKDIRWF